MVATLSHLEISGGGWTPLTTRARRIAAELGHPLDSCSDGQILAGLLRLRLAATDAATRDGHGLAGTA